MDTQFINPEQTPSTVSIEALFTQAVTVYDLIELLYDMIKNEAKFESEEDLQRLTFIPLTAPEPYHDYDKGVPDLKEIKTADYPYMWKHLLDGCVMVLSHCFDPDVFPAHPEHERFLELLQSWCEARTEFFLYVGSTEQLEAFLDSSFEPIREEQNTIHDVLLDRAKSENCAELGFDPEQPIDLQVENLRELTRVNNEQVLEALFANFVTIEVQTTNFVELSQYFRVVFTHVFVNNNNRTNLDLIKLLTMITAVKTSNLVLIAEFMEQGIGMEEDIVAELIENFSRQNNNTITVFTEGRHFIEDFMNKESEKIRQQDYDNQQANPQ